MVTLIEARALSGYSGQDHLIEDETSEIIGMEFRCVGDAIRAADKRVFIARHGDVPRRSHPYTWVKCELSNGHIVERTSV